MNTELGIRLVFDAAEIGVAEVYKTAEIRELIRRVDLRLAGSDEQAVDRLGRVERIEVYLSARYSHAKESTIKSAAVNMANLFMSNKDYKERSDEISRARRSAIRIMLEDRKGKQALASELRR